MPSSAAPDLVHASVVAGGAPDALTHYLRAGRGESVLLLSGDATTSNALITSLPRHFRLIAPNVPPSLAVTASGFHNWLRGFLDALGIASTSIVVGPCFAAQVLGFALSEPERIPRLVFLLGACGNSIGMDGDNGATDRLERAGQRLYVTPFDMSDPGGLLRTLGEISSFLGPEATVS